VNYEKNKKGPFYETPGSNHLTETWLGQLSCTFWFSGLHSKHWQMCRHRAKQVSSYRPRHLSQPRHWLGLRQILDHASCQGD